MKYACLRWFVSAAVVLAGASCSDDAPGALPDAGTDGNGPDKVYEEAALEASFGAWHGALIKECHLGAIYPVLADKLSKSETEPALDAQTVLARWNGRLWVREESGEAVILAQPAPPRGPSNSYRYIEVRGLDGKKRDMELEAKVDTDGLCVVQVDRHEVYRGYLWVTLPVQAHRKAGTGAFQSTHAFEHRDFLDPAITDPQAYVSVGALQDLVDVLKVDLDRARDLLARSLGVSADELKPFAASRPISFDHVDADKAAAPFPIYDRAPLPAPAPPLEFYDVPVMAVTPARLADWMPKSNAVTHSLRVRFASPALAVAGYAGSPERPMELPLRFTISLLGRNSSGVDLYQGKVLDIGEPREAATGGAAAAIDCFQKQALAFLRYRSTRPKQLDGQPIYPFSIISNYQPLAEARWFTLPCRVLTGDFAAALRSDSNSLSAIAQLLIVGAYIAPSAPLQVDVRHWDVVLADLGADDASLDVLAKVFAGQSLLAAGVRTQRTLLAQDLYKNKEPAERAPVRAVMWRAGLLCGGELSVARINGMFDAIDRQGLGKLLDLKSCPFN